MKVFALRDYPYYKKPIFALFLVQILNGVFQYILLFATPPVTKIAFSAAVEAYKKASLDYSGGGRTFKAPYEGAYAVVLGMLDELLKYVNELPNLTSEMIGYSGFHENNVIGSAVNPLLQAIFYKLVNLGGGVMEVEYHTVTGAEYFGMFIVVGEELPIGTTFVDGILTLPLGMSPIIIHNFTKQRVKRFSNLKPKTTYYVYCYSGNSATVSPLSIATEFTYSSN